MPADLRGYNGARQNQRILALQKPYKLYCWDGLDFMEVVNMYKYLSSVIEHNLKESWKAEKQFNFLCTRRLATEFSFPHRFSYPQMTFLLYSSHLFTTRTTHFLALVITEIPQFV